jgi:hypothetical protein
LRCYFTKYNFAFRKQFFDKKFSLDFTAISLTYKFSNLEFIKEKDDTNNGTQAPPEN